MSYNSRTYSARVNRGWNPWQDRLRLASSFSRMTLAYSNLPKEVDINELIDLVHFSSEGQITDGAPSIVRMLHDSLLMMPDATVYQVEKMSRTSLPDLPSLPLLPSPFLCPTLCRPNISPHFSRFFCLYRPDIAHTAMVLAASLTSFFSQTHSLPGHSGDEYS